MMYCPLCGVASRDGIGRPWCQRHALHGYKQPKLYNPDTGEAWFPCAECGKTREIILGGAVHAISKVPDDDYLCVTCRRKFDS
jgi:DNA-directed RNA polymerase subunit RPC12/RpoP